MAVGVSVGAGVDGVGVVVGDDDGAAVDGDGGGDDMVATGVGVAAGEVDDVDADVVADVAGGVGAVAVVGP